MNKSHTLLLLFLTTLFLSSKFTVTAKLAPKEVEEKEAADMDFLDGLNEEDTEDHEAAWEKVVAIHFSEPEKMHSFEELALLGYEHLIYEDVTVLKRLRNMFNDETEKHLLTEDDYTNLSNAMVLDEYLLIKMGNREGLTSVEAVKVLNHENYDNWMAKMPDNVADKLDKFMPNEDGDDELDD